MNVIERLSVELNVNGDPLRRGLSRAEQDVDGTVDRIERSGQRMSLSLTRILESGIGFTIANLSTQLAQIPAMMMRAAMDYQDVMGAIKAASGATSDEVAALGESARQLGVKYGIGASEAAQATLELIKAGVDVQAALDGATEAAIVMSRATGGTAADGATIAAKAMQSFGLSASQMDMVVQQAAGVINSTTFELQDYALALGQAGKVSSAAGLSFKDFNAAIAAISPAFTSGSDAGTSFKTFLNSLTPKTREAQAAMKALGLEFYDANGNLKGIVEIAGELQDAFGGMTQEQRSLTTEMMFGTDAQRAALALIDAGAEGLRKMRDEAIATANAQGMATERTDTLSGAMSKLGAAFGELAIAISESGLFDILEGIVRLLTRIVGAAADAQKSLNDFGTNVKSVFSGESWARMSQWLQQFTPGGMYAGSMTPDPGFASGNPNAKPPPPKGAPKGTGTGLGAGGRISTPTFKLGQHEREMEAATARTVQLEKITDRVLTMQQMMAKQYREIGDAFADGFVEAIVQGRKFGDVLKGLAQDILRLSLRRSIAQPISNWVTSAVSAIFGGFRAEGGPVSAGKSYIVGERGPERFFPGVSGTVAPVRDGGFQYVDRRTINFTGTGEEFQQLRAMLMEDQRTFYPRTVAAVREAMARRSFR